MTIANCTSYKATGPELCALIVNGIASAVLIIPAIILNLMVVTKYTQLNRTDRHKNSNFIITCQAIGDLFNVLITGPVMAGGYIGYYTDLFGNLKKKENSCPYWYMFSQMAVVASVTGRLMLFVFAALDRLFAVWKPVFWYNHLNGKYTRCQQIVAAIWIVSAIYSLGEFYGDFREFFTDVGQDSAWEFHTVRAVVCLMLTVTILLIWGMTFIQTYLTLGHSKKIRIKRSVNGKVSVSVQMSMTTAEHCVKPIYVNKFIRVTMRTPC